MGFIQKITKKGFFHIFGSNVLNKIVQFCSGLFLVRLLTKADYGNYMYSQNLLNMTLLLSGLGVTYALTQFGSETEDVLKKNSYFRYGVFIGVPFNLILGIFIILAYFIIDIPTNLFLLMCVLPILVFTFNYLQVYLRVNLENKKFSFISSLNTLLIFLLTVVGAFFFNSLGVVIGTYLAYIISILVSINMARGSLKTGYSDNIETKNFMSYSIASMANNGISQTVYLLDVFMLGLFVYNPILIATYKTATLIPIAMNFIPASIMLFIYPYIAKKREEPSWVFKQYKKITLLLLGMNIILVSILILLAPFIFDVMFGKEYLESVPYFRLLLFSYLIDSSFRIVAGNILAMLKKVKILILFNLIGGIVNLVVGLILISKLSIFGAALTNIIVVLLTATLYTIYLIRYLTKK